MNATARRIAALACAALCLAPAAASAEGRTIVGKWAPLGARCTVTDGAIAIGPLSLTADEMACTFRTVTRSGNVVTWKGTCAYPDAEEDATVVAAEAGGVLSLSVNGGGNGSYRRCGA